MLSAYVFFLLALLISTVVATPINRQPTHLEIARAKARYEARQAQDGLTGPVSFQTVTTTQTPSGTITTTCDVTLTPESGSDGQTVIRQEKVCKFQVDTGNTGDGGGNDNGSSSTSIAESTTTQSQETQTATASETTSTTTESASATTSATVVPAISQIGVTTIPASEAGTPSPSASASATGSTPPAISVIGTGQIPSSAAGTPSQEATSTEATSTATSTASIVTSVTTLSDGSLSTSTSTPSAAAAQEAAATTPGKKLEVLPIGLGVFAGVSVIALIVVGLVTYERTKYRKAFRQRKLAEAGANMGYGGMAERT